LFARGRGPLSEVLSELRAEETRLRDAGLLGVPSVIAARAPAVLPAASGPSCYSAPPILPTPSRGGRFSRGEDRPSPHLHRG
jgi:hypothetical protein